MIFYCKNMYMQIIILELHSYTDDMMIMRAGAVIEGRSANHHHDDDDVDDDGIRSRQENRTHRRKTQRKQGIVERVQAAD